MDLDDSRESRLETETRELCNTVTGLVNVLLVLNESLQFVVDVKTNCSPVLSVVRKG